MSTGIEVIRVHAVRVIASVANEQALLVVALVNPVRVLVCLQGWAFPVMGAELAVTIVFRTVPSPTTIRADVYVLPESFDD